MTILNADLVQTLAGSTLYREYAQAFRVLTGLPLSLRSIEAWQLTPSKHNRFCALMSRTSRSCAACLRVRQRVRDGLDDAPRTLRCPFGLVETAVGVKVGREVIACLETGQVFTQPPSSRQTNGAIHRLQKWGLELDSNTAAQLYLSAPVIRRRQYEATVQLLQLFAGQLGTLANQIVLQQRELEPEPIARARQFIAAHYREPLSLARVARQVGMSTCHFCKRFKKATGSNFTHYVCRLRVQNAKHLLLNPNYRINEIVYAAGFRSLTHFNRIFRRVVGHSPTDYRKQLTVALD